MNDIPENTPEPVPATNQAGEVDGANWRVVLNTARQPVKTREDMQTALNIIESVAAKALATQPATSQEGEDHGLGPHAAVVEDEEDGFMPVAIVVGSNVYLSQGGRQLTMSPEQFAEIASHSLAATPTPPTLSEDLREALENAHLFAVLTIAFLNRDRGTSRQDRMLDDLLEKAKESDTAIRAALAQGKAS